MADRQMERDRSHRQGRGKEFMSDRYSDEYDGRDEILAREEGNRERYEHDRGRGRYRENERNRRSDMYRRSRCSPDYDEGNRSRDHSRDSRDSKDIREGHMSRECSRDRDGDYKGSVRGSRTSSRERRDGRDWRKDERGSRDRIRNERDDRSPERPEDFDRPRNDLHRMDSKDDPRNQIPNNTIMVRQLEKHITENDIRKDILACGLVPKDIRLIRKKDTGQSRGYAFIEFSSIPEATKWMEMRQGLLILQNQCRAVMQYSIPKDWSKDKAIATKYIGDWICIKCNAQNFKRRDACYKCHLTRHESEEGSMEVSLFPTSIVLLRGLDVLSTKDCVLHAVKSVSNVPIQSIRIGHDSLTNISRGVCYLEMKHVMDAIYMHNALMVNPPIVDGRKVMVSYCNVPQAVSGSISNSPTIGGDIDAAIQYGHLHYASGANLTQYTLDDVPRLANYCASLYAKSPAEYTAYQQYYLQYYHTQISQGSAITIPSQSQADSVNAAAAVAQSAIQHLQAVREIKKQIIEQKPISEESSKSQLPALPAPTSSSTSTSSAASGQITSPDVSKYQYDESSGYYYDPHTGLYYDANTQYYYNSQTQQFLYWAAEKQAYLPAPVSSEENNAAKDEGKKGKEKDKQDKVKVAKKIAKDMERWAKMLNQKKDTARQNLAMVSSAVPSKSLGAADAGFAVLERKERPMPDVPPLSIGETETVPQAAIPANNPSGLVAAYGGGSESEEEIEDVNQEDRQHTNWTKLACLLCKRQFPTKESLLRHQQLSDLHKQNLEKWYRVRGLDPDDPQQRNRKYRDRARERRQKFGEPNEPQPNHLKEKYLKRKEEVESISYEQPTKDGIGSQNIGNKLLQKMGWQEGMGLGKSNQGRTSIIETEVRASTAGLGTKGTTYMPLPGETYKDCVKRTMFARYQELADQER